MISYGPSRVPAVKFMGRRDYTRDSTAVSSIILTNLSDGVRGSHGSEHMTTIRPIVSVWLFAVLLAAGAGEALAQWPQFRGPNGSGVDPASGYPTTFSPAANVVWKTAVPF